MPSTRSLLRAAAAALTATALALSGAITASTAPASIPAARLSANVLWSSF